MQVNLGDKIKELRKNDGRKQEDLAKALGVTPQAISRWEANGGYPDMGMIPSIANYFHITIDELFGYNNDRNKKIAEYNDKAIYLINNTLDMTECIALLRRGLEEFPTETALKSKLATALNKEGWNHKGEQPNRYWEEAASLYEELMEGDNSCIIPLMAIYNEIGEYAKAVKKASMQPQVEDSREVLLGRIYGDEDSARYQGEAVLALLHELRFAIDASVSNNDKLMNSAQGLEIMQTVRNLFETVFGDNCYGLHSDFCFIDMRCVQIAGNIGDYEAVLKYFDSAYEQYTRFKKWKVDKGLKESNALTDESFETEILKSVDPSHSKVYVCESVFLEYTISSLPETLKARIMSNPKYESIFTG